ncbi:MAG TPA: hypothetical protein VFW39_12500 [Sphingomicrobium sp.]|nr:hypothetical protein [Sphingomicrobium sp.]
MIFPILLSAALAVQQPAPAQPSPPGQAIVITGQKDQQKAIQDFVGALTAVPSNRQLSRFEHEVCPAVFGLAKPQAESVANRIRLVAKNVGIVVGGAHCAPNVLLLVTSDKTAFLKELQRHSADYFGLTDKQFRDLEHKPGPAAAWQTKGPMVTEDGVDLTEDTTQGVVVNRTVDPSSRITEPVHPQFDTSVVVVERKALTGMTVTQLADYTAVRALTGADPAKLNDSGAPTILHVLDVPIGGVAPVTMTKWDFSFLQGYYNARRNLRTGAQRSAIGDSMSKTLHSPPGK